MTYTTAETGFLLSLQKSTVEECCKTSRLHLTIPYPSDAQQILNIAILNH